MAAAAETHELLTIGHSAHPLERFVELLRAHEAELVADVRAHPGSRRVPQFGRDALAAALEHEGIGYVHLPGLGGRRRGAADGPNAGWRVAAFRAYADHMASAEFAAALAELEELASERRTAVMCAEGLWWRCHRRLVADTLVVRGWRALHVAPDGAVAEHELTDFAVVDGDRVSYPPAQASLPAH